METASCHRTQRRLTYNQMVVQEVDQRLTDDEVDRIFPPSLTQPDVTS